MTIHPLIFQLNGYCYPSVGVGTLMYIRLPRRHRAVPSASLDKSEYLIVSESL
jgi:hypothetical protein